MSYPRVKPVFQISKQIETPVNRNMSNPGNKSYSVIKLQIPFPCFTKKEFISLLYKEIPFHWFTKKHSTSWSVKFDQNWVHRAAEKTWCYQQISSKTTEILELFYPAYTQEFWEYSRSSILSSLTYSNIPFL